MNSEAVKIESTGDYSSYLLQLADDVAKYTVTTAEWNTETNSVSYTGEYYANNGYRLKLADDAAVTTKAAEIEYGTITSADTFTISGLTNDLSSISWTDAMSNSVVTITSAMLKDVANNVSISANVEDKYSLTLATTGEGSVAGPEAVKAHWATSSVTIESAAVNILNFKSESTLAGFTNGADGSYIQYNVATEASVLVAISGLNVTSIDDTNGKDSTVQDTISGITIDRENHIITI